MARFFFLLLFIFFPFQIIRVYCVTAKWCVITDGVSVCSMLHLLGSNTSTSQSFFIMKHVPYVVISHCEILLKVSLKRQYQMFAWDTSEDPGSV